VASIDAAAALSADPKAGEFEPDSVHRLDLVIRKIAVPRFGTLPSDPLAPRLPRRL